MFAPKPSRRQFLQQGAMLSALSVMVASLLPDEADAQTNPGPPPPEPPYTAWATTIVPAGEPGDPLIVSGRVFAPDGFRAVAGVIVYAYNTDKDGYYSPDGKVGHPRLKGYMKTDAEGRFELHTIFPGRYPNMRIPAHVHFNLWGADYPVQWTEDLRFEADSYLTGPMNRESEALGQFATIRPVTVDSAGVRHCDINLRLLAKSNFPGR